GRTAQRLDLDHLPRRLRECGSGANAARPTAAGRHLGAQQGPSPRPQATALHPHGGPRRCRALQFRVQSGNTTDDRSHRATWDLPCDRTGRRDFLYVADCKLATAENMAYIHRHGGRFLSVLPRTRGEDAAFRAEILEGRVQWRRIYDKYDEDGELVDRFA